MQHSLRMTVLRDLVLVRSYFRDLRCMLNELQLKGFRREVFKRGFFWTALVFASIDLSIFLFVEPFASKELVHELHFLSGMLYRMAAVLALVFVLFEPKKE